MFLFVGTVAANVAAPAAAPLAPRDAGPEPVAFDSALLKRSVCAFCLIVISQKEHNKSANRNSA